MAFSTWYTSNRGGFSMKRQRKNNNRQNHPVLRPTQNGFCGYDGEDPYPEQFQLIYWFICMCHHRRLHHTLENGRGFCKPLVFLLRNSGSACTCTGYLITVITQFKTRSKRTTNRSDRKRCQRNKILLFNLKSTS